MFGCRRDLGRIVPDFKVGVMGVMRADRNMVRQQYCHRLVVKRATLITIIIFIFFMASSLVVVVLQ